MQYRTLGRTGIKVSPYALGAMMFGASIGNPDHDDSIRIIHKALDAGINFIDTADAYSHGDVRGGRGQGAQRASRQRRPRDQVQPPDGRRSQPAGHLAALDHDRGRELAAPPADRLHRPLPDPPAGSRHRHRGDAVRALGPDPQRKGPCDRVVHDARVRHRRSPVGRRAARPGSVPHRAAALLDPQPRHRERGAADRATVRDGHAGVGPARAGNAHRPRPQGPADRPRPRRLLQGTSATSDGSTPSNSSFRSPKRRACR